MKRKTRDGSDEYDHWGTPKSVYDALDAEFHFDFDPCPLHALFDGLVVPWGKSNFVNPPYNRRDKPLFILKAYDEWLRGNTCVLLIPTATSTKQFHELILPNAEVRFVPGRIKFWRDGDPEWNKKPEFKGRSMGEHDSMIVIFRG